MQTRQHSQTHIQKGSYPFSHMSKEQQTWHDIKQTQYPKIIQTIQKNRTNPKDQKPPLISAGVYKILRSCGLVYHIGETWRMDR